MWIQNQHIMGWGGGNPEPSPGEYDWGSLDTRVEMMRRTGARMVITLCCAPDWMKGGEPGETDWSNLEESTKVHTDMQENVWARLRDSRPGTRRLFLNNLQAI